MPAPQQPGGVPSRRPSGNPAPAGLSGTRTTPEEAQKKKRGVKKLNMGSYSIHPLTAGRFVGMPPSKK